MKSCCGCLGSMFINFSVSHIMWVMCSMWNTIKGCFIVIIIWSSNRITIENVLCFYTVEHLRWLLCNWLWDICTIWKILVVGIKVPLPTVKCLCHFLLILVLKGCVWIYISSHKPFLTQVDSLFFFLAIVFTKQCLYCSQKFHSYALSFLHTASSHNYTKLNVCIWLWCVAKDCPWLSDSTLTVILILLHGMTELVLGLHSKCFVTVVGQYDSMTQSLYFILSIMVIYMWFVCVCVKNWAKFCSEYLKEEGLLGRTTPSWEYNIKMDV